MSAVGVFYSNASGTLSAVVVLHPAASRTLSAITVFAQIAEELCRPSQYLRKLRRYSVGRESISAIVPSTLSAVGVLHLAASRTLSAAVVLHPVASGTLSAVTILAQNEEAFCRPLRYLRIMRKYFCWM